MMSCACLSAGVAWSATIDVPAGADLQAALDAAQPGDVLLLAPGATYTGNFTLRRFAADTYVTVRTKDAAGNLPPAGVRVTPAAAAHLAKIRSPNTAPAVTTVPGAHHWRFELIEFPSNPQGYYDIIVLGTFEQSHVSEMPHHLIFDRVYVHGDPVLGQKRGITLNSGYTEIRNSYVSDIKAVDQDSQAIGGSNGSGPFLIENNYLEGAGQNVLFGGADPRIPNLVPSDITIRGNVLSKPLGWRHSRWQVKSLLQLKTARRVLVEGNVIENVWGAADVGFAIVITPRNQDGSAPWSVVEDVTFRYNIVRHAGSAINLTGTDDLRASERTRRVQFAHNVFYDIDADRWAGDGRFLQIGHSPTDVVVEHNTVLHSGNVISVYGRPVEHFVFRENLMRHNAYGIIGDDRQGGHSTINAFFRAPVLQANVLAGGDPAYYPQGNYFPSVAEFMGAFTNVDAGDFTLRSDSPFSRYALDGGPVGADVARVQAAVGGLVTGRRAVCRSGHSCVPPAQ
jgi:hypothetical protein